MQIVQNKLFDYYFRTAFRALSFLTFLGFSGVSSDVIGNPHSSIFDALATMKVGEKFIKVFSWYDNEWGFSNRMIDMLKIMGN